MNVQYAYRFSLRSTFGFAQTKRAGVMRPAARTLLATPRKNGWVIKYVMAADATALPLQFSAVISAYPAANKGLNN
jgi:hypothetical protein